MNRRLVSTLIALGTALVVALPLAAQAPAAPEAAAKKKGPGGPRPSPHEVASAQIDGGRVAIYYGRPYSARGGKGEKRKIWGELVPHGKIWRTGADEATLLVAEKPITIGGARVPAGAYTLWTLPAADGSAKLIVNKQVGQWGVPARGADLKTVYDEANDLARVDLTRETLEKEVEQFTIAVARNQAGGGTIRLSWENTAYSVPVAAAK